MPPLPRRSETAALLALGPAEFESRHIPPALQPAIAAAVAAASAALSLASNPAAPALPIPASTAAAAAAAAPSPPPPPPSPSPLQRSHPPPPPPHLSYSIGGYSFGAVHSAWGSVHGGFILAIVVLVAIPCGVVAGCYMCVAPPRRSLGFSPFPRSINKIP